MIANATTDDRLPDGDLPLSWRLVLGGVLECVSAAAAELADIPRVLSVQLTSSWRYSQFEAEVHREIKALTGE